VADLPAAPGELLLRSGDRLRLTAHPDTTGTAADEGVDAPRPAIPCTLPEVFADVRSGERILFDDGRIGGMIRAVAPDGVEVEITQARPRGSRLRADKGINLPDSTLHTPALTARDVEDLAFATAHADIVSYSFVNREEDVAALQRELRRLGREDLGVVLKIETRRAFLQLPRLLLAAMRHPAPLGVMIARGDLAIECGWDALAEIQEEILRTCEAAHVPCIWATQVLDEMARHGTPTRAEITDAAAGARAEALMLNKGPNITATVRTLRRIVHRAHTEPLQVCHRFQTRPGA
jgi:pyruvate kinase